MDYKDASKQVTEYRRQIAELRKKMREARAAAEPEEVRNYEFATPEGTVRLLDLFGGKDDLMLIHKKANAVILDTYDLARARASSNFDQRHQFNMGYVYDLPFFKTPGLSHKLLGGWQWSGLVTLQSGTPFSVLASGASLNAPGNTQTANQVVGNVSILGGHGPGQPYFDPNAFGPVTSVQFGNTGKDILRGPGLFNLNAGLFRDFALKENIKLQFRAEAYGLTNTPQFANPNNSVDFAEGPSGPVNLNPSFGLISAKAANPPSNSTTKRREETDLSTSCCKVRNSLGGRFGSIGLSAARTAGARLDGGSAVRTTRSTEE